VRFGVLLEDLTLSLALRSCGECRSRFWVGRWSYDEKVRLIEETMQVGETVCDVARRHGLAQSLLFTWRRQARQGCLGSEAVPTLFLSRLLPRRRPRRRRARRNCLRLLDRVQRPEQSRSSLAAVACALTGMWTPRHCSGSLSF
jgi:transposase